MTERRQTLFGKLTKHPAFARELDPAAIPSQQLGAQNFLQILQRLGDRRLAEVDVVRSRLERAMFDDFNKCGKMAELDLAGSVGFHFGKYFSEFVVFNVA